MQEILEAAATAPTPFRAFALCEVLPWDLDDWYWSFWGLGGWRRLTVVGDNPG